MLFFAGISIIPVSYTHLKEEAAKGHIQDAHEGIRPTDITREPVRVKESLSRDQFRLYQLIWRRFTASRMADAVYMMNHVQLEAGGYEFSAVSSKDVYKRQ